MPRKLDIFDLLKNIDKRNQDFYKQLTDEQIKEFAPSVAMRWASSASNDELSDIMLVLINERVNINFWDIYDHPELQYRLMASSGVGKVLRHQWIPQSPKKEKDEAKVKDFIQTFWKDADENEIEIIINQFDKNSFEDFVFQSGLEDKDAKDMIKSYGRWTSKKNKEKENE